jgi:hypothetical protein
MPTNNKTSLGLNSWLGTDKPKRSDFVEDNTILNTLLSSHFNDTAKHLSTADRLLLTDAFVLGNYTGTGTPKQVIAIPFEPRLVIVFMDQAVMNDYVPAGANGYNENNLAIVTKKGGSMGLQLDANKLTVMQSQSVPSGGGIFTNFNSKSDDYVYIAFR